MNNRIASIGMALALLWGLASCDDGPIYEKSQGTTDGKTARMEGTLTGLATWPSKYNVAIAGFSDEDKYAVISKVITSANIDEDGHVDITLSGIPDEVKTVELCVINRLRQRVVTLHSEDAADGHIAFDVGTVDVGMYAAIQKHLFDTSCTACHGASTFAAAGLNLTEGKSYDQMVNRASSKVAGLDIVTPGDAEGSVLHQVLNTDLSATWHQNHSDMLNKERQAEVLTMLDDWINNGANP